MKLVRKVAFAGALVLQLSNAFLRGEQEIVFLNNAVNGLENNIGENLGRPYYRHYAEFARWLTKSGSWGVMATSGKSFGTDFIHDSSYSGPFANVVDFADDGSGIPLFYLTELDPTASDAGMDSSVSFVVAEASFSGACRLVSAEEPTCSKMTLSGKLVEITDTKEKAAAEKKLFMKHPTMAVWPSNHGFKPYRLDIEHIFLIDFYGGAPKVSVEDYLKI